MPHPAEPPAEPMPATPPRRPQRNPVKILLTVLALCVMLLVMAAMKINRFFTRKVSISDVTFPVLILQPNGMAPFAEWDSTNLYKFHEKSERTPVEDTIVIDSNFNIYQQKNVKYASSDLGWLARRYIAPNLRVKYTFDLYRVKKANRDEAINLLLKRDTLTTVQPPADAHVRLEIMKHHSLAQVLDTLGLYKPIDPPVETVPTTEPAAIETMPAPNDVESPEPRPDRQ